MKTTIITHSTEEVYLTEHPEFNTPKYDWGVIPAHFEDVEWDEYGETIRQEWREEDRTSYRPDLEGKSIAYFWDDVIKQTKEGFPFPAGLSTFYRLKTVETITED